MPIASPSPASAIQHDSSEPSTTVKRSVWQAWKDTFGTIELENKGSVARDHLALERTYLAWLRTSLSFASIGIAISQLFRLNTTISHKSISSPGRHLDSASLSSNQRSVSTSASAAKLHQVGKPLGATFIAIAILVLLLGFHRYFESQHYVIMGKFPASRGSILLLTAITGALIVTILAIVLSFNPAKISSNSLIDWIF